MNINSIKAALAAKTAQVTSPNKYIEGNMALNPRTMIEITDNDTVLSTVEPHDLKRSFPSESPVVSEGQIHESDIETIIKSRLIQGRDYDLIAGCKKPSLLKAGAEKLASIFGYYASTEVIHRVEMYDKCFVSYEVAVTIRDRNGSVIAQGIGSCNSREKRYLKGDFCCQLNTVLKMAKKRAFVDAILTATGASGVFTQDIEDIG